MARIEDTGSGEIQVLRTVHRVGRSPSAHLRLAEGVVSAEHAAIRWTGAAWEVRDLGSRNGTVVDGVRLEPGQSAPLKAGVLLAFGKRELEWRVVDVEPPTPVAVSGTEVRFAEDGLIALPSSTDIEVCVCCDAFGAWTAESNDGTRPVRNGELVRAGGRVWVLDLGDATPPTREVTGRPPQLDEVKFEFIVSRDEEHVDTLIHVLDGRVLELEHRAHAYLVLTLARERDTAAKDGTPEAEQGWLYSDVLAESLNMPMGQFNMCVFRARQQVERAGVQGAQGLIERRRGSGQVRLGVSNIEIRRL